MKATFRYLRCRVSEPSTWAGAAVVLGVEDMNIHGIAKTVVFWMAMMRRAVNGTPRARLPRFKMQHREACTTFHFMRNNPMRFLILAAVLLVAMPAFAQTQPAAAVSAPVPVPPDMVLLPRALVAPVEQAILHPHGADVGDVLMMLQKFEECVADNSSNGAVHRTGADQCAEVTEAIAARYPTQPPSAVPATAALSPTAGNAKQ